MATTELPAYEVIDVIDEGFPFVEIVETGEVVIAGTTETAAIESAVRYGRRFESNDDAYDAYCRGTAFEI